MQNSQTLFFSSETYKTGVERFIGRINKENLTFSLFGTGNHTRDLITRLRKAGLEPQAVIVPSEGSFPSNSYYRKIIRAHELKDHHADVIVVSSFSFQLILMNELLELGIPSGKIFFLYEQEETFRNIWEELQKVESLYLSFNNCLDLFLCSNKIRNGRIVEIGSWMGRSSICLSMLAGVNGNEVFCIDPWLQKYGEVEVLSDYGIFEIWQRNISSFHVGRNIVPLMGSSFDVRKTWGENKRIDLLFIDGAHNYKDTVVELTDEDIKTYHIKGWKKNGEFISSADQDKFEYSEHGVKVDYDCWSPLINKGGFIVFHDLQDVHFPSVQRVWEEEIESRPEIWEVISIKENLGVARKLP